MGGSAGKKARLKRKTGTSTLDGKFNSIGGKEEQQANHALMVGKLGEVIPLLRFVTSDDRLFLQDVRIKLNQSGSNAVFGWRQIEAMVRIHTYAKAKEEDDKRNGTSSTRPGPANH